MTDQKEVIERLRKIIMQKYTVIDELHNVLQDNTERLLTAEADRQQYKEKYEESTEEIKNSNIIIEQRITDTKVSEKSYYENELKRLKSLEQDITVEKNTNKKLEEEVSKLNSEKEKTQEICEILKKQDDNGKKVAELIAIIDRVKKENT